MTDGIIQKVLEKHTHSNSCTCALCCHLRYIYVELIAEIKKTFDKEGIGYNVDYYNKSSLFKLIGDTQEIHKCQYSKCKEESKEVRRFESYEEGTVWLCNKHTELNIKRKTGIIGDRIEAEK